MPSQFAGVQQYTAQPYLYSPHTPTDLPSHSEVDRHLTKKCPRSCLEIALPLSMFSVAM